MAKFVKIVFLMLFAVAFYTAANSSFVDSSTKQGSSMLSLNTVQAKVSAAQRPYFPEAELASNALQTYQVMMSRIQRVNVLEYTLSLKNLIQQLASRIAALAHHSGRIYDTTTSYYCHPASEYYVFALRHIII